MPAPDLVGLERLGRGEAAPVQRAVLAELARLGPTFLAGGSVRDALLARTSGDLDLSVEGSLDEAAVAAERVGRILGAHPHLLGRPPRAVWRIEQAEVKVELWPLGPLSVTEDAARRDLTVNAMLWRVPDGPLVDPTGGLEDLRARTLRATSRGALADDPVRLLRTVRFLSTLPGFRLDGDTAVWIRELAPHLARAPRERVGREIALLAQGARPDRGVETLLDLGLLSPSRPASASPDRRWLQTHLAAFRLLAVPRRHPVAAAARAAGPTATLALLLRALRATEESAVAAYAWARPMRHTATAAAGALTRLHHHATASAARRRELIHALGEAFPAALAAAAALDTGLDRAAHWRRWWRLWRRRSRELLEVRLLLTTTEVLEHTGPLSGEALGRVLRALRSAQVRGEVRTTAGAGRLVRRLSPGRLE